MEKEMTEGQKYFSKSPDFDGLFVAVGLVALSVGMAFLFFVFN